MNLPLEEKNVEKLLKAHFVIFNKTNIFCLE